MDLFNYLSENFQIIATEITPLPSSFNIAIHKIKQADSQANSALYLVIKSYLNKPSPAFLTEAEMLTTLKKAGWPVPEIIAANEQCLLMEWLENDNTSLTSKSEVQLGQTLARLHQNSSAISIEPPFFGYKTKTPIGALTQPNDQNHSWIDFFRQRRLIHFANIARSKSQLPETIHKRLLTLSDNLDNFLHEPPAPVLIHGDIWAGNVMIQKSTLTGFIDPAIYFAHPEVELAFIKMFHTFGTDFFKGYNSITPIEKDFHKIRAPLYNLYPTLVHLILFGKSYLPPIERTLNTLNH